MPPGIDPKRFVGGTVTGTHLTVVKHNRPAKPVPKNQPARPPAPQFDPKTVAATRKWLSDAIDSGAKALQQAGKRFAHAVDIATTELGHVARIVEKHLTIPPPTDAQKLAAARQVLLDAMHVGDNMASSPESDRILEDVRDLDDRIAHASADAPLDADRLLQRAAMLHRALTALARLETLEFSDASRSPTQRTIPVTHVALVGRTRTELADAALANAPEHLFTALHHVDTLAAYAQHLANKQHTFEFLRVQLPEVYQQRFFTLHESECDNLPDDPLHTRSDAPCDLLGAHPLGIALNELRTTDPAAYARLASAIDSVLLGQDAEHVLAKAAAADDPFGHLTQQIATETDQLRSANFAGLFERAFGNTEESREAKDYAARRAALDQAVAAYKDLETIERTLVAVTTGTDTAIDEAALATATTGTLQAAIARMRTEAEAVGGSARILAADDFYRCLNPTPVGPIEDQKVISTARYDADDYVGATDAPDAPDSTAYIITSGPNAGAARQILHQLGELEAKIHHTTTRTDMYDKERVAHLQRLLPEMRALQLQLVRMRLAATMQHAHTVRSLPAINGDDHKFNHGVETLRAADASTRASDLATAVATVTTAIDDHALQQAIANERRMLEQATDELAGNVEDIKSGFFFGLVKDPQSTKGMESAIATLTSAQAAFDAKDYATARQIYQSVLGTPTHRSLLAWGAEHQQMRSYANQLMVQAAITIASLGAAGAASKLFTTWATTRGVATVPAWFGARLAGAGAFYASDQTLQSVFTADGGWGSRSLGEHAEELGWTALLFITLDGATAGFEKAAASRLARAFEAKTGISVANHELFLQAWTKSAGWAKRALYQGGKFAFENLAFLGFDTVKQAAHTGNWNLRHAASAVFTPDNILHNAGFLLSIKLSQRLTQPLLEPAVAKLESAVMGQHGAAYARLQADGKALAADMVAYYSKAITDPASADPIHGRRLLARYAQYTQTRAAFFRGLPEHIASRRQRESATADAAEAADVTMAVSPTRVQPLTVDGTVLAMDRVTVDRLVREGHVVSDGPIYRMDTAEGPRFIVAVESVSPPPAATTSPAADSVDRVVQQVVAGGRALLAPLAKAGAAVAVDWVLSTVFGVDSGGTMGAMAVFGGLEVIGRDGRERVIGDVSPAHDEDIPSSRFAVFMRARGKDPHTMTAEDVKEFYNAVFRAAMQSPTPIAFHQKFQQANQCMRQGTASSLRRAVALLDPVADQLATSPTGPTHKAPTTVPSSPQPPPARVATPPPANSTTAPIATSEVRSVVLASMSTLRRGTTWKEADLRQAGRAMDGEVVAASNDPKSSDLLIELAQGNGPRAQAIRQLLGYYGTTNPPEMAWRWLMGLTRKVHVFAKDPSANKSSWRLLDTPVNGKPGTAPIEVFDRIVNETNALYARAAAAGVRVTGNVIETVATADIATLEQMGATGRDAGSKAQGSRAELHVLQYLLQLPDVAAVEVISRVPTGRHITTPDFRITFRDSAGHEWVELWDIKSRYEGMHEPVDREQFDRAGRGADHYRVIQTGGAANSANSGNGISVHHIPNVFPTVQGISEVVSRPLRAVRP